MKQFTLKGAGIIVTAHIAVGCLGHKAISRVNHALRYLIDPAHAGMTKVAPRRWPNYCAPTAAHGARPAAPDRNTKWQYRYAPDDPGRT